MAEEILKRDGNHVTVLGGVTDNVAQEVTMLRVDSVTKRLKVSALGSAGIASINTDTTSAQFLNVGTTGDDFNIDDDSAGTHTFNLPDASSTARGVITIGAQEISGVKTFNEIPILPGFTIQGSTSGSTVLKASATASGTITLPAATDTLVGKATTDTLTNKRVTARVVTTTQSATPTINTDNTDVASITGLAQAITSFTTNLSGTPVAGDTLIIEITDNGTARAISWGASFEASTVALPTTTVISTLLTVGFRWNSATSKWRCVAQS